MRTKFIREAIWAKLSEALQNAKQPCHVAVAYFGTGASKLLPLPAGSKLVVNASEDTVSHGLTCPAELSVLINRDVKIFSVADLHAKVYVIGKNAYVGSANVSKPSANRLKEAVLVTNDAKAVADAREFVESLCFYRLTPKLVAELVKIYKPPLMTGGKKKAQKTPALPRVQLAQLKLIDWSDNDYRIHDEGLVTAKKATPAPARLCP